MMSHEKQVKECCIRTYRNFIGCNEEFKAHLRWKSQVAIDGKLAGTILALAEEFGMRKRLIAFTFLGQNRGTLPTCALIPAW